MQHEGIDKATSYVGSFAYVSIAPFRSFAYLYEGKPECPCEDHGSPDQLFRGRQGPQEDICHRQNQQWLGREDDSGLGQGPILVSTKGEEKAGTWPQEST